MNAEMVKTDRTSIAGLIAQAREAHAEKRTRDCFALIKTILSTDPEHAEAKEFESAIQQQISRDLNDARALLEDSRMREDGQKYRRAAEIVLLKTLNLDPENPEALALMSVTRGAPAHSATPIRPFIVPTPPVNEPADPRPLEELEFTIGTPSVSQKPKKQRGPKFPFVYAGIVALVGILVFMGYSFLKVRQSAVATADVSPLESSPATSTRTTAAEIISKPVPPVQPAAAQPVVVLTTNANRGVNSPAVPATDASKPTSTVANPPAATEGGTLAVTSLVPADIYRKNIYVGSTPATLRLPAGNQTVEYRHGDLRTFVTHNIKSKETTTALVTFEIVVQINARPWAQVFIDGTTKRPLGQTPLSDIRVPLGSVLVFENPNFPSKSYRVTEKETAIQMVFP
jgi:hypothetical protein